MRPQRRYSSRGSQFVRQWKLLVLLRWKPHTLAMLSVELGCHGRTVRRDLEVLQAVGLPIVADEPQSKPSTWAVGSMPEWPAREVSPVQELRVGA